ncbi:hypothetical protein CAPTEDRAFT_133425 [Capitella teleta]|uniref:Caveolin n=1 Tax=Capitella teleta TaxID=283909 RepID=R7TPM2_CAPTE|nr:hypothetical protein CAPTEDRAFT_133425 [Capitella teleta]|eukprot:ELT95614.1 hypothetical protein CAPTEDRAFT_133425 [Capitella teleta]
MSSAIITALVMNRDAKRLNYYLIQIRFEDIIGEPDPEVYSLDKVWLISFKVFTVTKLWCYRITSVLFAIPCALIWGVWFACLAFCRIWCCVPCLRSYDIEFACVRRIIEITLQTCCAPCYEAIGRIFSGIRIRLEKAPSF